MLKKETVIRTKSCDEKFEKLLSSVRSGDRLRDKILVLQMNCQFAHVQGHPCFETKHVLSAIFDKLMER